MIADLKPYSKMKKPSAPSLGDVPAHWEVTKLRNILKPVAMRRRGDLPLLSVVRERGVIPRDTTSKEENHNVIPEDLSNYKVVRVGQFAMNKMKAWQGSYGVSRYEGIVSPAYFVFDLSQINGDFFHVAIRSRSYVPFFAQASDGVRVGQWDLSQSRMKEIPFAVPPAEEQKAIARFLNHATLRVGNAIRAKQKLIKLLEEEKQVIIHHAVTRGLDPDVRLKSSGIEWLHDVPAHWEVMRLKNVASHIVDCLHATPIYNERGQFPAIRTADITPGVVRLSSTRRVDDQTYRRWTERLAPAAGDILYSREGERFGIAACVPAGIQLCISQRMMVFRIQPGHSPVFVMWLLNDPQTYAQAKQDVMGSTAPHVNISTIRNFALALPPLEEQHRIVEHMDSATRDIGGIIEDAIREIALLREYRTRLIADVVTGKLDVREAAKELPEEASDMGAADEAESLADDESAASDEMEETAVEEAEA